jgi:hypothetical protein
MGDFPNPQVGLFGAHMCMGCTHMYVYVNECVNVCTHALVYVLT